MEYTSLDVFNSTAQRLIDLVNSNLDDPVDDVNSIKVLQNMLMRMHDVAQEMTTHKRAQIHQLLLQNGYIANGNTVTKRKVSEDEVHHKTIEPVQKRVCVTELVYKRGDFTVEEDAAIVVRVRRHLQENSSSEGDSNNKVSSDVWAHLEMELSRPAKYIKMRWRTVLSKISWVDDDTEEVSQSPSANNSSDDCQSVGEH